VDAAPVAGPPPRALAVLEVHEEGDQLRIGAAPAPGEVLAADAVILATEIGALHKLARSSAFETHAPALAAAVAAGGEADPYAVVRYWFDRPVNPDRAAFYTVSEYKWTDSIAVYSAFQEPYTRSPLAVIESHAYAIAPEDVADAAHYADALLAELREIFPELRDAKVTHQEAMAQSNFTRFAPNDFEHRPEVATEIPNLFLAGDHVKLPFPAFLMEAAAASGRIAANHILAGEDVAEDPVRTVALRGQLADVFG
jgi:isorenieratene synthase